MEGTEASKLREARLKAQLLEHIAGAKWRGEADMAKRFGGPTFRNGNECLEVSDALFALVLEEKIEWFGSEEDGSKPLRYRLKRK